MVPAWEAERNALVHLERIEEAGVEHRPLIARLESASWSELIGRAHPPEV